MGLRPLNKSRLPAHQRPRKRPYRSAARALREKSERSPEVPGLHSFRERSIRSGLTIALGDCASDHRAEDSADHRAGAAVATVPAHSIVAAAVVMMAVAADCGAEGCAGKAAGDRARGRVAALVAVVAIATVIARGVAVAVTTIAVTTIAVTTIAVTTIAV